MSIYFFNKRGVCVLLFVIGFLFGTANMGQAIGYSGVGGRPAFPQADNPRTEDIYVHSLSPGANQEEGILVLNNTDQAKKIQVFSTDSSRSTEGAFACEQISESKDKVGGWITFGKPQPSFPSVIDPTQDQDNDGLSLEQEEAYLTDPNDSDSDDDGFLDGTEVYFGYNPNGGGTIDGALSRSELSEEIESTIEDKEVVDSDSDGLNDTEEANYGTDPLSADTDGDGATDKEEIDQGDNPLQPIVVNLDGNSNIFLPFTISVPKDTEAGEHNGCIIIEEKKEQANDSAGVHISTRVGLRVAITIPGDIIRKLEILDLQILPSKISGKIIHPIVQNLGNVSIDANVQVTVINIFGKTIEKFGGQYPVLRGETSEWNFEFPQTFWGGWYEAALTVEYDPHPEAGVGLESGKAKTVLTGPTQRFFIIPSTWGITIYAGILFLIITTIILLVLWRKRKKWIAGVWKDYTVQSGDGLKQLAKTHNVSWRVLAKANKLKPPYDLEVNSVIIMPPRQDN